LKLGVPEKTLDRILKDYLEYLGLAQKDGVYWVWYENKKVFQSKHDYDIALKHSRRLFEEMIPDIEDQPFDNPEGVVGLLISKPTRYAYLLKHLRTGYFKDFWTTFQAYYDLMEKYGFPHVVSGLQRKIGELQFELLEYNPDIPSNITQAVFYKDTVFIPNKNEERGWFLHDSHGKALNDQKMKKDFQKLIELQTELVKELLFLMSQVQHGTPLRGYCGCCPDRRVTIKSKS